MCQIIARTHKAQEIIHFCQLTNPLKYELMKATLEALRQSYVTRFDFLQAKQVVLASRASLHSHFEARSHASRAPPSALHSVSFSS